MRLVKNYENKNTQTNKYIISTLLKETSLFEIRYDNEVSKKLMKSRSLWKEPEKRREIYINRDSVCLYNESEIKKKRFFLLKKKSKIWKWRTWELFELKLFSLNRRSGREVYLKSKILKLKT